MILISHRGNLTGKIDAYENEPNYVEIAIKAGYDVEIDVWRYGKLLYLGHDTGKYGMPLSWFYQYRNNLWIHCKSLNTLVFFKSLNASFNYFYHTNEDAVLTSNGTIWAFPGTQPLKYSIAVIPEIHNDDLSDCIGICSDNVENYKN